MRLDTKQKIIRYSLIGFGIAMLLFLIIFNGVWFGDASLGNIVDNSFGLSFTIPLLVSINAFSISGYFKSFTKQDAINQIEKQYKNGLISTEHYKKSLREIEMFELEKNKLKAEIEAEKEIHKKMLIKEVKEKVDNFKQEKLEENLIEEKEEENENNSISYY